MLPLIFPLVALLSGAALLLLGTGLLHTLLAIRGGLEGYDAGTLGYIMSGYFAGYFFGTYIALPLIKRIGHIRAFALCAAVASCSVLLYSIWIHPVGWFLLRVITGATMVILYTIVESWLHHQTPAAQRGQVFAIYMAVTLGSLAVAQQFLHLSLPESFTLFVLAAVLVNISLVPVTWTRLTQPTVTQVERLRFKTLYRVAPIAVAGAALSGVAMGAFWGVGAVYAGDVGLGTAGVATFLSCGILGGALGQLPLGRFSDNHDRRRVLIAISTIAAVSAALLSLSSTHSTGILITIGLYGSLAFAIYPVAVAHLLDHLAPDDILAGGSSLLLLHGLGAAVGPALAGQLMDWLGPQALPIFFITVQLLLAVFAVIKLRQRKTEELEYPVQFTPMVRTSPTALEMLPEEDFTDPETTNTNEAATGVPSQSS